jgi:hypothetical protein
MENELTYETKQMEFEKSQQLYKEVNIWVERNFNFIQVDVLNKYTDDNLMEYILYPSAEDEFYEWLTNHDVLEKIKSWKEDFNEKDYLSSIHNGKSYYDAFIEIESVDGWNEFREFCLDEYADDINEFIYEQENYPMWNTCFEFRDSFRNNYEDNQIVMKLGMGVISGLEDFNDIIFMKSAGHSFYGSYWIPLYLEFYPDEKQKYKGVKFSQF